MSVLLTSIANENFLYHLSLTLAHRIQNIAASRREKYEAYRDMVRIFLKGAARYFELWCAIMGMRLVREGMNTEKC